jgi:hypothetical protein
MVPTNYDHSSSKFEIQLVIATNICPNLSNIEHEGKLIVTNFWQLFSQIFGRTLLIVTNIWLNLMKDSITKLHQELHS